MNLIIIGHRHDGRDNEMGSPFGAYAKNTQTDRTFYLASYRTEELRERLAPILLKRKMENPSDQFKSFMNAK